MISTLDEDLNIIQSLSDLPNDEDGLSADQLKAKFDGAANLIKEYINDRLVPQANADIYAASLGVSSGQGVGTNSIADSAVTTAKIADGAVTTDKISASNITTALIANLAVTSSKIADSAITSAKIASGAVTGAKISNGAVSVLKIEDNCITSAKLSSTSGAEAVATGNIKADAVTTAKIADSAIATAKIADGAVTSAKLGNVFITRTATLSAGASTWTITVNGVTASNVIFWDGVNDAAHTNASNSNIRCTAQATNSLTFIASSATTVSIPINILIINA